MKKLFMATLLLALALVFTVPAMAGVDVNVNIGLPLPPPIFFPAPPALIVLPETDVYAVPDVDVDIFFYDGWWWRPWEGRWYRSRNYSSGWGHYRNVPSFFPRIHPGWRDDYRKQNWKGHQWNHQRIPHERVEKNWKGWKNNRHWERQESWGVRGLEHRKEAKPRQSKQRQGKHNRGD